MNRLDRTLELLAAREPPEAALQAAQRKLEETLAARGTRSHRGFKVGGWLAAAASAVVAAAVWLPLALAPATASAFERVQQRFRDFHTLRYDVSVLTPNGLLMSSRVIMTRDGDVRAEMDDTSTAVINVAEKRFITLVHPAHMAVVVPIDENAERPVDRFIEQLRHFRGTARRVLGTKVIDGHETTGWEVTTNGHQMKVWATEEGLPLEVDVAVGSNGLLQVSYRFEFDAPIPAETFDTRIPAGYRLGEKELEECRRSGSPLWSSKTTTPPLGSSSGSSASISSRTVMCPSKKSAG